MNKRPSSVTIISWLIIAFVGLRVIMHVVNMGNPDVQASIAESPIPIPVHHAIAYIGAVIALVSGIAMLKAMNWGRWLYVIWSAIGFVVAFITPLSKLALLPGLVVFVIFVVFLFRPAAGAYFTGGAQETGPPQAPPDPEGQPEAAAGDQKPVETGGSEG